MRPEATIVGGLIRDLPTSDGGLHVTVSLYIHMKPHALKEVVAKDLVTSDGGLHNGRICLPDYLRRMSVPI